MKSYFLNNMNNKFCLGIILSLSILISFNANAQDIAGKELKSLVIASFNHFPKIKEAENGISIATEKIKLIELNKQPDVTADAGYSYIRPKIELPINGEKFQFAPLNNFSASLTGTYTLLDFGRIKAAIEQSKNELSFSEHNKERLCRGSTTPCRPREAPSSSASEAL